MKYGVYCVKDNINGFASPIIDTNDASALRNFAHAMFDKTSMMFTHPSDYTLYKLGVFDSDSGFIETLSTPQFIDSGSSVYISIYGGSDAKVSD